jgi:hypothetical protein
MATPYYLDDFALKTFPTYLSAIPEEDLIPKINPTNAEILQTLALGNIGWSEAVKEYAHLSNSNNPESFRLWKLIRDGAELSELTLVLNAKSKLHKLPKDSKERKSILDFLKDKFDPGEREGDEEYHISWVDIYRKTYQRLERIIETYTNNETYTTLDKIFDHSGTAQYLKNEFLLEQTRPISEAHINLDIDEYSGVHQDKDEDYIKVPDHVTLEDHNGVEQTIELTNLKDMSSWSGDLSDPDHEQYDEDAEGDLPSASIYQWENAELQVTDKYYELRTKYHPMILEMIRRIESEMASIIQGDPDILSTTSVDHLRERAADNLKNTRLARWFAKALRNEFHEGTPIQDIAALLMVDIPIPVEVNGNLSLTIDQFGDDILESIIDSPGMNDHPEYYWESALEEFHQQTIELMKEKGVNYSPKWSSHFVISAFKSIVEDHQPVGQAISNAYDDFRSAVSPEAANAFRQAIAEGKGEREAMRAFYETAKQSGEFVSRDRILRASDNRVVVLTASSGYTEQRELNWRLFRFKANQGEIFVPKDTPNSSKKWLHDKLVSLGWNSQLISKLAE